MTGKDIVSIVLTTAAVFAAVWGIGSLVKKIQPRAMRHINWVVSATAFVSGLAAYATGEAVYMYIFLASLISYFLTINYKAES